MANNDQSKTCILITSNSIFKLENKDLMPTIVALKHPRTGKSASFLLTKNNSTIEEIFLFSEKRSWFIDNTVVDEAKIYFSTPVDPLFLILPYLLKIYQEKKAVPLEDLLVEDIYPEIYRFLKRSILQNIHLIADKKGPEDLNVWMYNEQKIIEWLKKKIEKVAEFFNRKPNYEFNTEANSANFVKSLKNNSKSLDNEMNIKYAYELVSEYLMEELSTKLLSSLGLPVEILKESITEKRKLHQDYEGERQEMYKKVKISMESNSSYSKDIKFKSKEKSTGKYEKGSQQITSFFKGK